MTTVSAERARVFSRATFARSAGSWLPVVVVALVIAVVYLPRHPPADLDVFLKAGRALVHHEAVYPASGTPAAYSGTAFVYPVAAAWPFVPLSLLPRSLAVGLWALVSLVAVVAACRLGPARPVPTAVCVLLCSFAITGLQAGALSPLLFAGLILSWRLRQRPLVFGLVAGTLVAAKLFLLPILVWPLLMRRWAAAASAAAVSLGLVGLGFLTGPIGPQEYLRLLRSLAAHESARGLGLISGLQALGLSGLTSEGAALGVAALVVAIAWQARKDPEGDSVVFTAGVVVSLLLTPVLWSHYLLLLAAPLVARRATPLAFWVFAAASWLIATPYESDLWTTTVGVAALACAFWLAWSGRPDPTLQAGSSLGNATMASGVVLLVVGVLAFAAYLPAVSAVNAHAWPGVALVALVAATSLPATSWPWSTDRLSRWRSPFGERAGQGEAQ